jgi:transposase
MPKEIPTETRRLIQQLLEDGWTQKATAERTAVSLRTVKRVWFTVKEYGLVHRPRILDTGRPAKLGPHMVKVTAFPALS